MPYCRPSADYTHADRAFNGCKLVQSLLARALRHISDHIANFAFGAKRLGCDIDVLFPKHVVHLGEDARQIRMKMRDTEVRTDIGQV